MTLLPFQPKDVVVYLGEAATVVSVRGDRIAVETSDRQTYVTTDAALRTMQPPAPKVKDSLA